MCLRRQVMAAIVMCIASSATAAPRDTSRTVSARIYDYAHFDSDQLDRAQQQVSATYRTAGVNLEWHRTVSPDLIDAGKASWPDDGIATITVVLLAAHMGPRIDLRPAVAGYAPITRRAGGRIAYVVGDRIQGIALAGKVESWTVIAGVMTHEIAHLLMPERTHTAGGVMRPHWFPDEFSQVPKQRFSEAESRSLRRTVSALGAQKVRVAD